MFSRFGNATLSSRERATSCCDSHAASTHTSNGSSLDVAAPGSEARCGWCARTRTGRRARRLRAAGYSVGTSSKRTEWSSTFWRVVKCTHPPAKRLRVGEHVDLLAVERAAGDAQSHHEAVVLALRAHAVGLEAVVVVGAQRPGSGRAHRVEVEVEALALGAGDVGTALVPAIRPPPPRRRTLARSRSGTSRECREHRDHREHREPVAKAGRLGQRTEARHEEEATDAARRTDQAGDRPDVGGVAPPDELEHRAVADAERPTRKKSTTTVGASPGCVASSAAERRGRAERAASTVVPPKRSARAPPTGRSSEPADAHSAAYAAAVTGDEPEAVDEEDGQVAGEADETAEGHEVEDAQPAGVALGQHAEPCATAGAVRPRRLLGQQRERDPAQRDRG